ncbi:MAG: hypothetical protein ABI222_15690 [Opitutaceae bacterium]
MIKLGAAHPRLFESTGISMVRVFPAQILQLRGDRTGEDGMFENAGANQDRIQRGP